MRHRTFRAAGRGSGDRHAVSPVLDRGRDAASAGRGADAEDASALAPPLGTARRRRRPRLLRVLRRLPDLARRRDLREAARRGLRLRRHLRCPGGCAMTDTMPTDVRATITALFPERVAEEQQRERRAAGQVGTAALLESIGAVDAELRRYAERLLAGGADDAPTDAIAAVAELRDAILALRLLNARREMARLSAVMAAEPDAPAMGRWRERFAELMAYVLDLERSGK